MIQNDLYHVDIFHLGFWIVYQKYITKRVQGQLVLVLRDDVGVFVYRIYAIISSTIVYSLLSPFYLISLFFQVKQICHRIFNIIIKTSDTKIGISFVYLSPSSIVQ